MERNIVSQIWQIEDPDTLDRINAIHAAHNIPLAFRFHCRETIEDYMSTAAIPK